jgi:hypothetical protein
MSQLGKGSFETRRLAIPSILSSVDFRFCWQIEVVMYLKIYQVFIKR